MTLVEADGGDLCEADDGNLDTARSRTPQLPPRFNEASHAAKTFFFLPASVLKVKKFHSSLGKLVVCPGGGRRLPSYSPFPEPHGRFPRTPQFSLSFSKASHTAKTSFFLRASQFKAKKLNPSREDDQFLKYCTVVT